MSEPLEIVAYEVQPGRVEIRPAEKRRAWMDETTGAFAYRCLPIAIANQHGWEVLCPFAFSVIWDGGPGASALEIDTAGNDAGAFATSHFGAGILTFNPLVVLRTPPGYNLWLSGPANAFKDGIQALTALVETDWMPYTFSMNWKITRPNTRIEFAAGEAFAQFFPVPRGVVAACAPRVAPIGDDADLENQYRWAIARRQLDDMVGGEQSERVQGWYRRGDLPAKGAGRGAPPEHELTIDAKPFRRSRE